MSDWYDHLVEQRDAVLAGARVSPRDRARIMGAPLRPVMAKDQGSNATLVRGRPKEESDNITLYPERGSSRACPIRMPAVLRPAGANQVDVVPDIRATMARARAIIATVADVWSIEPAELLGLRRTVRHARPRHAAMALIAGHLRLSLPSIGRIFGRDHTTVADALARAAELRAKDACFAARYREADRQLAGTER